MSQTAKLDKKELISLIGVNETISQKEAAQASKKTSEFRNRAHDTLNETTVALDEISSIKINIRQIIGAMNSSKLTLDSTLEQQNEYLVKIREIHEISNTLMDSSSEAMCSGQVQPDTFLKELSNSIGD